MGALRARAFQWRRPKPSLGGGGGLFRFGSELPSSVAVELQRLVLPVPAADWESLLGRPASCYRARATPQSAYAMRSY